MGGAVSNLSGLSCVEYVGSILTQERPRGDRAAGVRAARLYAALSEGELRLLGLTKEVGLGRPVDR